jgi:hypothetical protein
VNKLAIQNTVREIESAQVLDPVIASVAAIIVALRPGWVLSPADAQRWALLLSGFDAQTLRFAALEFCRQRTGERINPEHIAQFAGWLQRARRNAAAWKRRAKGDQPDAFAESFLAACGDDTRAFVASGPARSIEDDADDEHDAHMLSNTLARLDKARARDDSESIAYFETYAEHLSGRMSPMTMERAA